MRYVISALESLDELTFWNLSDEEFRNQVFQEIIERYSGLMWRTVWNNYPCFGNVVDFEDIKQEVLERLRKRIGEGQIISTRALGNWLRTCVIYVCSEKCRRKSEGEIPTSFSDAPSDEENRDYHVHERLIDTRDPLQVLEWEDWFKYQVKRFGVGLNIHLSPKQKQVMVATILGYSNAEIRDRYKLSTVNNVCNIRRRAREILGRHGIRLRQLQIAWREVAGLNGSTDRLGVLHRQCVPWVIQELENSKDIEGLGRAAYDLGRIGSVEAVPALIKVLEDEDNDASVTFYVAKALGWIGDAKAVPVLVKTLGHEDARVRNSAWLALGNIGQASVPALTDVLNDGDMISRRLVASLIITIFPLHYDMKFRPEVIEAANNVFR